MQDLPGIDIGIPTDRASRKAAPEDTHAAVTAALNAGADGLIFSRKYSEMNLANPRRTYDVSDGARVALGDIGVDRSQIARDYLVCFQQIRWRFRIQSEDDRNVSANCRR